MQELSDAAPVVEQPHAGGAPAPASRSPDDVVSTHVLVPEGQAQKLKELSRKTRVAQSEYLREAVDDLLGKYGKLPPDDEA